MHIHYHDILEAAGRAPEWWLNGVPRFNPFRPEDSDVYAQEAALLLVQSQGDGRTYRIGVSSRSTDPKERQLSTSIANRREVLNIADPDIPNDGEDHSGATMTALQIEVLEFWKKDPETWSWKRDERFELHLIDKDFENATPTENPITASEPAGPNTTLSEFLDAEQKRDEITLLKRRIELLNEKIARDDITIGRLKAQIRRVTT